MDNISSILKNLLPIGLRVGAAKPVAPRTAAELDNGLETLDAERVATNAAIDGAHRSRQDLLRTAGTEVAIGRLDAEIDRLNVIIERLDIAERSICDQLSELRVEQDDTALNGLVAGYRVGLHEFEQSMSGAIAKFNNLQAIRARLDDAGLGVQKRLFELPASNFPLNESLLEGFGKSASAALLLPRGPVSAPAVYAVKFLLTSGGFNAGEVAAFPADHAWKLVLGEVAAFADRRKMPPRPIVRDLGAVATIEGVSA